MHRTSFDHEVSADTWRPFAGWAGTALAVLLGAWLLPSHAAIPESAPETVPPVREPLLLQQATTCLPANPALAGIPTTPSSFVSLGLGQLLTNRLTKTGAALGYRVETAAGQHLIIQVRPDSTTDRNQIFVKFGEPPTLSQWDAAAGDPEASALVLDVGPTRAGTYFILVYAAHDQNTSDAFRLRVDSLGNLPTLAPGGIFTTRLRGDQDFVLLRYTGSPAEPGRVVFSTPNAERDTLRLYAGLGRAPSALAYNLRAPTNAPGVTRLDLPAGRPSMNGILAVLHDHKTGQADVRLYAPMPPPSVDASVAGRFDLVVTTPPDGAVRDVPRVDLSGTVSISGSSRADLVVVLDRSTSIRTTDPEDLALAGVAQLLQAVPATSDTRLALVEYNRITNTLIHLTADRQAFRAALAAVRRPGGGETRTAAAIRRAAAELVSFGRRDAERGIILFSDGAGTDEIREFPATVEANSQGFRVHTIFLGDEANAGATRLAAIAHSTYGRALRVDHPEELPSVFQDLARPPTVTSVLVRTSADASRSFPATLQNGAWNVTEVPLDPTDGAETRLEVVAFSSDLPPRTIQRTVQVRFRSNVPPPPPPPPPPPSVDLAPVPAVTALEDAPPIRVPIQIQTSTTNLDAIRVSARSPADSLIDPATLTVDGQGSIRELRFGLRPNRFGSDRIELSALWPEFSVSANRTVQIEVLPVNDAPTLDPLGDLNPTRSAFPLRLPLSGIGAGPTNELQSVRITATADNTQLLAPPRVTYASPSSTGTLELDLLAGASGTTLVSVTARDDGGTQNGGIDSTTRTFRLTVAANQPPRIALTSPLPDLRWEIPVDLNIVASASDPDGQVAQVEFFANGTRLGERSDAPFALAWTNVPPGFYELTARARDDTGLTTVSAPVRVEVYDPHADVALVALPGQREIERQREALAGMDLRSRVIPPERATFDALSRYRLVIWSDAGRSEVTGEEMRALWALREAGKPLYFIGERLATLDANSSASLPRPWRELIHLAPDPSRRGETYVEILPEAVRYFGFAHSRIDYRPAGDRFEAATADGGQALARSAERDVLVAFPLAGEPDVPSGYRGMTQNFPVLGTADSLAQRERQLLFQAIVCWLLRCSVCSAFNLNLDAVPESIEVVTGEVFDIPLAVFQRYCISTGVELEAQLPPALEWIETRTRKGNAFRTSSGVTLVVGQLAAEERLEATVRLLASQPGLWELRLRAQCNESPSGGADSERAVQIVARGEGQRPALALERTDVNIALSWPAWAEGWLLEVTSSIAPHAAWEPYPGSPSLVGNRFVVSVGPTTSPRFFRLRR